MFEYLHMMGELEMFNNFCVVNIQKMLQLSEIGCCMSHLKAIKDFYDNTDDEYCMIVEDDVNFESQGFGSFSWNDIIDNLPLYWDCIQLTTICTGDIHKDFI